MPGNRQVFSTALNAAEHHRWDSQWPEATREYQRALAEFPEDPAAHGGLGFCFMQTKQWQQALSEYEFVLTNDPGNVIALSKVAELYGILNRRADAYRAYLHLADLYSQAGQGSRAEAAWQKAVQLSPGNPEPHERLAAYYFEKKDIALMLQERLAAAQGYLLRGQLSAARMQCEEVLRADANNIQAQQLLAQTQRGQPDSGPLVASAGATNSVSMNPGEGTAQELSVSPVYGDTSSGPLAFTGNPVAETMTSGNTSGGNTGIMGNMGSAGNFGGMNNSSPSLAMTGSNGGTNPSPRKRLTASQVTGVLKQAQAFQTQGRFNDAIDLCEQILESGFDRPDARYFLGWLYQEQQRWDEAIHHFQLLLNDPDYALSCYYALGQCYRARGDLRTATVHFDEAVDRVNLDALTVEESDQLVQLCQEAAEAHRLLGEQEQALTVYNALLGFLRSRGWAEKVAQVEFMLQQAQNAPVRPATPASGSTRVLSPEQLAAAQQQQQPPAAPPPGSPVSEAQTMAFSANSMAGAPPTSATPPVQPQVPNSTSSVGELPDWLTGILSDADKTQIAPNRQAGGSTPKPAPMSLDSVIDQPTTEQYIPPVGGDTPGSQKASRASGPQGAVQPSSPSWLTGEVAPAQPAAPPPPVQQAPAAPVQAPPPVAVPQQPIPQPVQQAPVAPPPPVQQPAPQPVAPAQPAVPDFLTQAAPPVQQSPVAPPPPVQPVAQPAPQPSVPLLDQNLFAAAAPSSGPLPPMQEVERKPVAEDLLSQIAGTKDDGLRQVAEAVLASTAALPENVRLQVVRSMQDIQKYINHGLLTSATEECLRVIDIAPQYLDVHQVLCEIYVRQGKIEQAITKYAILVDTYIVNGRTEDAIATYRRILQLEPNNLTYRMRLINLLSSQGGNKEDLLRERTLAAESYLRLGYMDRALTELEQALQESPTSVPTRLNYALALQKLGRMQQSVAEYQRVLQIDPRNVTALVRWHIAMITNVGSARSSALEVLSRIRWQLRGEGQKQSDTVIREYNQAADIYSNNADIHFALGQIFHQSGQFDRAIDEYTLATRDSTMEVIARTSCSHPLLTQGKPEAAIQQLDQALQAVRRSPTSIDPATWAARPREEGEEHQAPEVEISLLLAKAYGRTGRQDQMQAIMRQVKQARPAQDEVASTIAEISSRRGDIKEAVQEHLDLARHYRTHKQIDNAITVLNEAVRLMPQEPRAHEELANIYVSRGLLDEGIAELRLLADVYLRLNQPENAAEALQRIGNIYSETGNDEEALMSLSRAAELNPSSMELLRELVGFCWRLGRTYEAGQYQAIIARHYFETHQVKESVAALQQLIAIDRNNHDAYDMLGQTYQSVGEYEQASRVYRNLAKVNPGSSIARDRLAALQALRTR